jgi:hypothetical protein
MDFELLKQEAEKSCSVFAKEVSDAKRKLATLLKRQDDTKALLVRLQKRKSDLTDLADESVAGDVNSFEKFKVSLRKVKAEIEATSEALSILTDKIISSQRDRASESAQRLQTAIVEFWRPHQKSCEAEMRDLLDQVIRLRDDFQSGFVKTADDCGLQGDIFLGHFEIFDRILPYPSHPRFSRIEILPGSKTAQDTKTPAEGEPQQAVPEPVQTPQAVEDGQTASEPVPDTPETLSPDIEAQINALHSQPLCIGYVDGHIDWGGQTIPEATQDSLEPEPVEPEFAPTILGGTT